MAGVTPLPTALSVARAPQGTFAHSGLYGGGFANVVAVDPRGSGTVIAGSDVGGLQVGTGNGASFIARNGAATDLSDMAVASIVFATRTRTVYAAIGRSEGHRGVSGFLVSHDNARRWKRLGGRGDVVPEFSGGHAWGAELRSTGKLIALDESSVRNGHPANIYAATSSGVMRSQDGGRTWTMIGLRGDRELRSLALDPADPRTLYVASYAEGVWVSHNANATDPDRVTFELISGEAVPNSPGSPEELVVLSDEAGSTLFASAAPSAGRPGGVYKYVWGIWVPVLQRADAATWFALDGYSDQQGRHLIAGCREGCPRDLATGVSHSLWVTHDGGRTWDPMLRDAVIHDRIGGPKGPVWWLAQAEPNNMLGGKWYRVAQIAIDPTDHQRIFLAGRSGVWRSEDGGANWYPTVSGMLVTVATDVAVDPRNPSKVYTALSDWGMVYSYDHGRAGTVHRSKPSGAGTHGQDVAVDPVTGKVYLSLANADGMTGSEIFSSQNPSRRDSWRSERLGPAVQGAPAAAIAVVRSGKQTVLLAAVVGSGIWEKVIKQGGGRWRQALMKRSFGPNLQLSSVQGTGIAYAYDPGTGDVWMSRDSGHTWGAIWSKRSTEKVSGFIAANTLHPNTLYVSTDSGMYALTGTNARGGPTVNHLTALPTPSPGPVAVDAKGVIWVTGTASRAPRPTPAGLWHSVDGGSSWTNVANNFYRNSAPFPWALAVAPDGYQYLALRGNGLFIGHPAL